MQATARTDHPSLAVDKRNFNPLKAVKREGKHLVFISKAVWLARKRHKPESAISAESWSAGRWLLDMAMFKDRCTEFFGQRPPPHGALGPFLGGVSRVSVPRSWLHFRGRNRS